MTMIVFGYLTLISRDFLRFYFPVGQLALVLKFVKNTVLRIWLSTLFYLWKCGERSFLLDKINYFKQIPTFWISKVNDRSIILDHVHLQKGRNKKIIITF